MFSLNFNSAPQSPQIKAETLPTDRASVKEELCPVLPGIGEKYADFAAS